MILAEQGAVFLFKTATEPEYYLN